MNSTLAILIAAVVLIGGGIVVTVVAVKGNQVRLLVDAPRDVPVLRAELVDLRKNGGSHA